METQNNTNVQRRVERVIPPDQLSPKAVLLRIISLKDVFRRYWKLMLALTIIGAVIGKIVDISEERKPIYNATIKFNLGGGSSSGGGMGELGALASAFGLGGSAPEASIFVGDNFMIYAISRPVVEKTLMKTVKINGKDTLLVNYYIRHSGIRDKEWEDDDSLRMFYFDRAKTVEEYSKQEINAMAQIYTRVKGEITVTQPERKSSFMELWGGMQDEMLTKVFIETHLQTIEEDYREKQNKKNREVKVVLKHRVDSLYNLLTGNENRLAKTMDQNLQMVVAAGKIQETKLMRNSTFLSTQYYQAVQSLDNLQLSMIKEAPLFTEIEPVYLPLYKEVRTSIAMQAGLVLGLIISLLIVFLRETYISVMREE